jgi:hypothetical protein
MRAKGDFPIFPQDVAWLREIVCRKNKVLNFEGVAVKMTLSGKSPKKTDGCVNSLPLNDYMDTPTITPSEAERARAVLDAYRHGEITRREAARKIGCSTIDVIQGMHWLGWEKMISRHPEEVREEANMFVKILKESGHLAELKKHRENFLEPDEHSLGWG